MSIIILQSLFDIKHFRKRSVFAIISTLNSIHDAKVSKKNAKMAKLNQEKERRKKEQERLDLEFQMFSKLDSFYDTVVYPTHPDKLFWCFYIIKYGFAKYNLPDSVSFSKEKEEKFVCIKFLREHKGMLLMNKIRLIADRVEEELGLEDMISLKTFWALCIVHNVNIMIIINKTSYVEQMFDSDEPWHVLHYNNCLDENKGHQAGYEPNVSMGTLKTYREHYFKRFLVDKPLQSLSNYKLPQLQIIYDKYVKATSSSSFQNIKHLYDYLNNHFL